MPDKAQAVFPWQKADIHPKTQHAQCALGNSADICTPAPAQLVNTDGI